MSASLRSTSITLSMPAEMSKQDPAHYTRFKIEPIDAIEDWGLGFRLANAVKYIARCEHKGEWESDLKKAIWYIQRELKKGSSPEEG